MGVSRSATVVCAYVIATAESSMTASEAIAFVKSKRPAVRPNPGFRMQLESWATRFAGRRTADEGSSGTPASQIRAGILDTTIEEGDSSQAELDET
jgi:atypical dual specificity phosphatase